MNGAFLLVNRRRARIWPLSALLTVFLLVSSLAVAAPKSEYWALWDNSNPASTVVVDHSPWQAILNAYLVVRPEGNGFRYARVSAGDRKKLKDYLATLTAIDPHTLSKAEQKAYWINLYNALTVNLILDNYPVKSITDIGPWYSFGPWDMKITRVAGQDLTLNDIEHRILRPLWQDERIHYAVNCASIGCPDLAEQAFTAQNTDPMLSTLARRFVQQQKGVSLAGSRLMASRIYEWYQTDFTDQGDSGVIVYLRTVVPPALARQLRQYSGPIQYQYNWALNAVQ